MSIRSLHVERRGDEKGRVIHYNYKRNAWTPAPASAYHCRTVMRKRSSSSRDRPLHNANWGRMCWSTCRNDQSWSGLSRSRGCWCRSCPSLAAHGDRSGWGGHHNSSTHAAKQQARHWLHARLARQWRPRLPASAQHADSKHLTSVTGAAFAVVGAAVVAGVALAVGVGYGAGRLSIGAAGGIGNAGAVAVVEACVGGAECGVET